MLLGKQFWRLMDYRGLHTDGGAEKLCRSKKGPRLKRASAMRGAIIEALDSRLLCDATITALCVGDGGFLEQDNAAATTGSDAHVYMETDETSSPGYGVVTIKVQGIGDAPWTMADSDSEGNPIWVVKKNGNIIAGGRFTDVSSGLHVFTASTSAVIWADVDQYNQFVPTGYEVYVGYDDNGDGQWDDHAAFYGSATIGYGIGGPHHTGESEDTLLDAAEIEDDDDLLNYAAPGGSLTSQSNTVWVQAKGIKGSLDSHLLSDKLMVIIDNDTGTTYAPIVTIMTEDRMFDTTFELYLSGQHTVALGVDSDDSGTLDSNEILFTWDVTAPSS